GGAQNICEKIADTIGREHILTKELVTDITSNSNYVEVTTKNCSYCCYNVIIAVAPKDILKIKFEPTLPRDKIEAIENTSTNIVTNFVVTYPSCPVYKEDVLWQLAEYFGDGALNPTDYYEKSCPTRRSRRKPIKGYEDPFYITAINMKNYIPVGLLIFLILWRLKNGFLNKI
ncbi:hypothetical protein NQ314_000094, partial [Rhamnusium bicolor]